MPEINNDATDVKPAEGFEVKPKGLYKVIITESSLVPTKATTGKIIKYKAEILDGPFQGQKLFHKVNWENPSAEAQRIGRAEQSAIQHGAGKLVIRDTSELHNIPMYWDIGVQPEKNGYPESNRVNAVYHVNDPKVAGKMGAQAPAGTAPAAPPSNRPPAPPQAPAQVPQPSGRPGWQRG